ncbi:MAG: hypothetical protein WDA08_11920 [Weeksellaceae bacterium]
METDFIFKSAQISVSACGSALSAFYLFADSFWENGQYDFRTLMFRLRSTELTRIAFGKSLMETDFNFKISANQRFRLRIGVIRVLFYGHIVQI